MLRESSGQGLIEVALMMPVLMLLMAYAIDCGYFFIAAANISSAARNGVEYSVQGYQGPSQSTLPTAGPIGTATSVSASTLGDLVSLANSATIASIQVCTKNLGMNGNVPNCSLYGAAGSSYTPAADPEPGRFTLQRVDVTYTVEPPVPLTFFTYSLLPTLQFHRQVSMRVLD